MRVLFVTNRFPRSGSRGDQLRAFEHIRALASRHAISLLSFAAPETKDSHEAMRAICAEVICAPRSLAPMVWHGMQAIWNGKPLQVAIYAGNPAQVWMQEAQLNDAFDLVHVQLARLGTFALQCVPTPCVVDLVDALSLNMQRRAERERSIFRWLARWEGKRLKVYEQALCQRVSGVVISADIDRQHLACPSIQLVPNGVHLQQFKFVRDRARNCNIAFVGNLGYFPNIEGITWFAREVMPNVVAKAPAARLRIIGKRPGRDMQDLASELDFVDLIGEVPDVFEELSRARLSVVPLRAGSGQQLKLIEAMAAGTPVVTTSTSANGLQTEATELHHEGEVLIADDAIDMSDAVLRLLKDDDLCQSLAMRARAFVESHHGWDHSAACLEAAWFRAVQDSS